MGKEKRFRTEDYIAAIAAKVAAKRGGVVNLTEARLYHAATFEVLSEALTRGYSVLLPRVGTIRITVQRAYRGYQPSTGEEVDRPAHSRASFRTSRVLRRRLSEKSK